MNVLIISSINKIRPANHRLTCVGLTCFKVSYTVLFCNLLIVISGCPVHEPPSNRAKRLIRPNRIASEELAYTRTSQKQYNNLLALDVVRSLPERVGHTSSAFLVVLGMIQFSEKRGLVH